MFTAQGWAEAFVVKGMLESSDIPVRLGYEALGSILGLTLDGLGEVKIMVSAEKEEEARKLLQEANNHHEWDN